MKRSGSIRGASSRPPPTTFCVHPVRKRPNYVFGAKCRLLPDGIGRRQSSSSVHNHLRKAATCLRNVRRRGQSHTPIGLCRLAAPSAFRVWSGGISASNFYAGVEKPQIRSEDQKRISPIAAFQSTLRKKVLSTRSSTWAIRVILQPRRRGIEDRSILMKMLELICKGCTYGRVRYMI